LPKASPILSSSFRMARMNPCRYAIPQPPWRASKDVREEGQQENVMHRFSQSVSSSAALLTPAGETGAVLKTDPGLLPEWDLSDLYPSADSPALAADMEKAARDAVDFEARWKGRLGEEAAKANGGNLAEAIREYEALAELMGRIGSFAGLYYYGDTTDPK